jgi:hypothetical protein
MLTILAGVGMGSKVRMIWKRHEMLIIMVEVAGFNGGGFRSRVSSRLFSGQYRHVLAIMVSLSGRL